MADLLKKELGLEPEMVIGNPGEFSVLVDGRTVARKGLILFPADRRCLEAVRRAMGG